MMIKDARSSHPAGASEVKIQALRDQSLQCATPRATCVRCMTMCHPFPCTWQAGRGTREKIKSARASQTHSPYFLTDTWPPIITRSILSSIAKGAPIPGGAVTTSAIKQKKNKPDGARSGKSEFSCLRFNDIDGICIDRESKKKRRK